MRAGDFLAEKFSDDYWTEWQTEFGHNFFDTHLERTIGYDQAFVRPDLQGKKLLEVGGYPGLLMALYLARGCKVSAIDSPHYRPQCYLDWCEKQGIVSHAWDIQDGPPQLDEHFDAIVMSDVLLHNEGFPSSFLGWCIQHADKVYLLNYTGSDDYVRPEGKAHTLRAGFSLPSGDAIIKEMERLGATLITRGVTSGRELLVFGKNQ